MNIIFGNVPAELRDKHIVLELDTFVAEDGRESTAWAVIENIPLSSFPVLDAYIKVHHDLLAAYRNQDWDYCESALKGLAGQWNGAIDSFYQDLMQRVEKYRDNPPVHGWTGRRRMDAINLEI